MILRCSWKGITQTNKNENAEMVTKLHALLNIKEFLILLGVWMSVVLHKLILKVKIKEKYVYVKFKDNSTFSIQAYS